MTPIAELRSALSALGLTAIDARLKGFGKAAKKEPAMPTSWRRP